MTACCFQEDSWIPWADCKSSTTQAFIDEDSCRTTQAFLCLAVIFVWLAMMYDRRNKFKDALSAGDHVHTVCGLIYRKIQTC